MYIYTDANTMVMGQVNVLVVLFLLLYALRYHSGIALTLCRYDKDVARVYYVSMDDGTSMVCRDIYCIVAITLSFFSLLCMDFTTQFLFYTDILPSFSSRGITTAYVFL